MSKKPKKFLEECGLERDEEVDANVDDYKHLVPQKPTFRRGSFKRRKF